MADYTLYIAACVIAAVVILGWQGISAVKTHQQAHNPEGDNLV